MFITRHLPNKNQLLITFGLLTIFLIVFISFYDHPKNTYMKTKIKSVFTSQTDYTFLINMNFSFQMLPLVCADYEEPLLILVHSATDHFNNRKVIRETWGKPDDEIRLLFLVGVNDNIHNQKKLEEESKAHGDILQGNFVDTYHNLTYKHVMALKYVFYHCPKAPFMLKVDDDTFVNIPTLKVFLSTYFCEKGIPSQIFCSTLTNNPALRSGKWGTTFEEYPDKYYPKHCGGFAILYPQDVIYPLYREAQRTKFFWVDDVFVSGICAKKANITHIGIERFVLSMDDLHNIIDLSFNNMTKPFLIGKININERQIRGMWDYVTKNVPKPLLEYLTYS